MCDVVRGVPKGTERDKPVSCQCFDDVMLLQQMFCKHKFFTISYFFVITHLLTLGFLNIFLSFEFTGALLTFIKCDEGDTTSSRIICFVTAQRANYCKYGFILYILWIRQTWRMGPLRNEFILICQQHRCHSPDGNKWNKALPIARSLRRVHEAPC